MSKNVEFEKWVADRMNTGIIVMEPYGYRKMETGEYLQIFKISLTFDDVEDPFEGVAFIPISYPGNETDGDDDLPYWRFPDDFFGEDML